MIALDDNIEDHPKFVGLSNDAFALWVRGIGYCRRNLTDGFIPEAAAASRARSKDPKKTIAELTAPPVGLPDSSPLWVKVPGGYRVHDYLQWNPSKADVEAKVQANREKGRRGGLASGRSRSEANAKQTGSTKDEPTSNQSRSSLLQVGFAVGSTKTNPDPIRSDPEEEGEIQTRAYEEQAPGQNHSAQEGPPPPPPPPQPLRAIQLPPQPPCNSDFDPADVVLTELRTHRALELVADREMADAIIGRMMIGGKSLTAIIASIREAAADASPGIAEPQLRKMVRKYADHAQPPRAPQPRQSQLDLKPEADPRDAAAAARREKLKDLKPPTGIFGRSGSGT